MPLVVRKVEYTDIADRVRMRIDSFGSLVVGRLPAYSGYAEGTEKSMEDDLKNKSHVRHLKVLDEEEGKAIALYVCLKTATSLPVQNATGTAAPEKVGWTSTPQVRGTFDLLLSCLTTLFLCAWTAYHPNVQVGRSEWRKTAHRCVWMVIAVFLPEVVLWCAWEQLWAARRLMGRVNDGVEKGVGEEGEYGCHLCRGSEGEGEEQKGDEGVSGDGEGGISAEGISDEITPSRHSKDTSKSTRPAIVQNSLTPWTTETAFFALSGGLALPHPSPTSPPLTLTPQGILLLLRLNLLPEIPLPTIADKSKADAIAKTLVCVQAAWFLIQCIARAAKGLPVTSLEVHVLAHVACAFAIYAVWWGKGYDVGAPMVVDGEDARDLGALFAVGGIVEGRDADGETTTYHCSSSAAPLTLADIAIAQENPTGRSSTRIYSNKLLEYFELRPRRAKRRSSLSSALVRETPELRTHLERANHALQLLQRHDVHLAFGCTHKVSAQEQDGSSPSNENGDEAQGPSIAGGGKIYFGSHYTVHTRSDLTIEGLDHTTKRTQDDFINRQVKTYAFLTTAYASIHLLALSPTHFPTQIEHRLWLASTASMIAAPIFFMAVTWLDWFSRKTRPPPSPSPSHSTHTPSSPPLPSSPSSTPPLPPSPSPTPTPPPTRSRSRLTILLLRIVTAVLGALHYICLLVALLGGACYPFARMYLLGESFAGLRAVDADVYKTVEWTEFVPHAG
ncbi:hypothetical protein K458DRAFT_384531 [Lentithecium fluviatile CBS 122367]|uniref:Uncharacterized protein n=1 Tax=Lentithecium fluviatile CBS 122367 TaxID=1168545 RepID=A0A6G1JCQ9_9PLEO|nr:hypothetical protein K458DRAFT_384531 [Lentithecium fluviatile CBS 122367]